MVSVLHNLWMNRTDHLSERNRSEGCNWLDAALGYERMLPDQAFDLFGRALALLEDEDHSGWSAPAKSALLTELAAVSDRLEALIVRTVGEWDADRSWEADGARSAASWMSANSPVSKRDAHTLVRTARVAR